MLNITIFIAYTINVVQSFIILLMIARVVLSWLILLSGVRAGDIASHPFFAFVITVTEFVIYPVRVLFSKLGIQGYIIDFPFIVTFILISAGGDLLIEFIAGAPVSLSIF